MSRRRKKKKSRSTPQAAAPASEPTVEAAEAGSSHEAAAPTAVRETPAAVAWWEIALLLLLLAVGGLWSFEERGVLYFDELINAAKAAEGRVFDYSLRPIYRLVNIAVWSTIGENYESLRIFALVCYGFIALLLFWVMNSLQGRSAAWLAFLAFACSETVLVHGIRGMPHLPAGLFLVLSLCCFLWSERRTTPSDGRGWSGIAAGIAAGLLALLSVGIHPTMLSFVTGLGSWAAVLLVVDFWRERTLRSVLTSSGFSLLAGLALGSAVLLDVGVTDEGSYFEAIFAGIGTVQSTDQHEFYHRPWNEYLNLIGKDRVLAVALGMGVLLGISGWVRAKARGSSILVIDRPVVGLSWIAAVSLLALSVVAWKFERVLVSYVPLFGLAAAGLATWGLGSLALRRRAATALAAAVMVAMTFVGGWSVLQATEALDRAVTMDRKQFHRFSDVVGSVVGDDEIGYLGDGRRRDRAYAYVGAAGKEMTGLISGRRQPLEQLEDELLSRGISYLVVDFIDPEDPHGKAYWWDEELTILSVEEVYEHRDWFKLWRLLPKLEDEVLSEQLKALDPGVQIAVLGWPAELGEATSLWIDDLLASHRLRDYRLSLLKAPEIQFRYVRDKDLRYVWVTPESREIEGSQYEAFRQILVREGWRLTNQGGELAELWVLDP